jgi:predicted ester cyclase
MAEAIGRAEFDAFEELMAPELAQEFKQGIAELRRSFPDYHGTSEIQVAEGDMVANRFIFYGTHQGEFMGVAPTGREVTFRGLSLDRVVDGKIVESIVELDLEDVLRQIGAVMRAEPSEEAEEASPNPRTVSIHPSAWKGYSAKFELPLYGVLLSSPKEVLKDYSNE